MYMCLYIYIHRLPALPEGGRARAPRSYNITYYGDHTEPPHPHPRNLVNMVLTSIYTIIHIY